MDLWGFNAFQHWWWKRIFGRYPLWIGCSESMFRIWRYCFRITATIFQVILIWITYLKMILNSKLSHNGRNVCWTGATTNFSCSCILRPLTDTFAGLNGRGAKPADATLTALGCPLPEPSEMSVKIAPHTACSWHLRRFGYHRKPSSSCLSVHIAECPLTNAPVSACQRKMHAAVSHTQIASIIYVPLKEVYKIIVDFFFCTFFFRYKTEDTLRL